MFRWLAPILLFAGCAGGSGSSGFDISPSAERALIARALSDGQCVSAGGSAFCPIDKDDLVVPLPNNRPQPVIEGVSVTTGMPSHSGFSCNVVNQVKCVIHVELVAVGLPEGSSLQIVWRQDDGEAWHVRTDAQPLQSDGRTEVIVELPVECTSIQVAALVFINGNVLAHGEIDTLSESQAPIAFVMAPSPIVVEASIGARAGGALQ